MGRSYTESDDDNWNYSRQALWDNAVRRATYSKRGQKVLREIEAALLALPEKRLIEGLLCDGTGVCAVGALAAYRKVQGGMTWTEAFSTLDESSQYDIEDGDYPSVDETAYFAEDKLKMSFAFSWDLAFNNDHRYGRLSPEARYEAVLKWVRARLKPVDEVAA